MIDLKKLSKKVVSGKLSRRDFMVKAIAAGATVPFATHLLAESAKAATPNKGGNLRMGIGHGSTTDSTNPATWENGYMANVAGAFVNHLAEVNNKGEISPELAESWESSPDAATWRFKLRKGLEFHNGKTVTAEDVIASFNHHRGDDTTSGAKGVAKPIKDIKADGDTVVFELEGGNADFPFIASDYHFAIMPSKDGKIGADGFDVGTGGFMIESYEPGVRTTFKRNPNYFKEGMAHFDSVEMLSILDANARQSALITGDIDIMDRVDLKTVDLLARNPAVNIMETTGTLHYTFPMRTDTAPFDNNDVRMALKLAFDRQEIVDKVLFGHGSVGNDHPISSANQFHNSELPQRQYDPEKAKWHLKQAGMEGLTVELSAADAAYGGAVDAAVLYKERAAAAGINIEVVREPNDGYWSNVWMNKPWCACYWGGRPTEDWMFSTAYQGGVDWNDTFWSNERFDALLLEARSELDQAKRHEMYGEMQAIVSNQGGVVVPMFANYVMGLSSKIAHHDDVAGNWDLDGNKAAERWWFS